MTRFIINPFTGRLDAENTGGGPGGFISTITGNDSVAVGAAVGGNINIVGGTGVTVTGNAGTNTLTITSGKAWTAISASQTLAVNNGYACISPGGALSLALPAVSDVGSIIEITLDGSTRFVVTQGAGQQIRIGNLSTTAGVAGSLTSTQQGDSIRMVCSVANLKWNVLSSMGNPIIA